MQNGGGAQTGNKDPTIQTELSAPSPVVITVVETSVVLRRLF